MPIQLPKAIADYFAADQGEREAVAQCFTEDGAVKDEDQVHRGRVAIAKWKAASSAKYQYTSEPLAVKEQDGRVIVSSRVAGDFPGSPVNLRYLFSLEGGKIASLEIVP